MYKMNEMGNRIRSLRLSKGWTQTELGRKVGLQASVIAKYENGFCENMKRSVIQKMAEAFGVRPSYLMGFEDSTPYYVDEETHEIAQMLLTRPELQVLFDASKDASREDIETAVMLLERMSKK